MLAHVRALGVLFNSGGAWGCTDPPCAQWVFLECLVAKSRPAESEPGGRPNAMVGWGMRRSEVLVCQNGSH